ncbi:putative Type 1 protein exporter [Helianthus annuus]|nr:putative Type 1 protein exporter [Helianthus annuus]KAJ0461004.1 putative Type 1 protein exporter [Helianthus annuus]KAJ0641431.1 putative Type 1 protein exporter [Helianthus annuus]
MSNMIEVFYFDTPARMERKTKEYVFIYVGAGLYAVVAYLIQHYFFSIMGDNLTTRVRRMMFSGICISCEMSKLPLSSFLIFNYFKARFVVFEKLWFVLISDLKERSWMV